jgi:hypothetical protein
MKKIVSTTPPAIDATRVIKGRHGFYWQDRESGEIFGPFATVLDAVNDMKFDAEAQPEPGETVQEAEAEIGVADWIDPETGEPAEEQVPRVEQH